MIFSKKFASAMELLKVVNTSELKNEFSFKSWPALDGTSVVAMDQATYHNTLEDLATINSSVAKRFSRKTIYKFIEDRLPRSKRSGELPESSDVFFKDLLDQKPKSMAVSAPISGIRLDGPIRSFEIACFRFGYLQDMEIPIANESGMYISTTINDVYDAEVALQRAESAFSNFTKLIVFLSGRQDKTILIETGLPLRPNLSDTQMYVSTSSHQIQDEQGKMCSAGLRTTHVERIPVNNDFFSSKEGLGQLWTLYARKHAGRKLGELEARILNSALALGKSASTKDIRDSILYSCIALEIAFSRDDGALFQKSIGQNLADLFAFIVAKDASSRKEIAKLTKNVYGMRSSIVHGGDKEMSSENLAINHFLRGALNELLTADRFKDAKNLNTVFEMLSEAQYSY